MKILSAQQVYEADKFTIEKQQISSDALMERAALGIFNWIHQRLQGNKVKIHLFCGIGNNGGDGLALARHLMEHDYSIDVYVVNYSEKRSKDFLLNLDRLKERKLWPEFLNEKNHVVEIGATEIVVDAIFGIGLNRSPSSWVGHLIHHINASNAFVLSLDIPSGLFMERVPGFPDRVIRANHVLSFQCPKLPFFLPETGIYLNQWELLDIGLDQEYLVTTATEYEFIGKPEVLPLYNPRLKFSHKGDYGHALLIGGSYGKIGAVDLAVNACLKTGAGLVTAFVPKCGYVPLQVGAPEAMVITDEKEKHISEIEVPFVPSAIGVGMGMGTHEDSQEAFAEFLEEVKSPLVIDADGLNTLSKNKGLLDKLPEGCVLTPRPGELKRLIGAWKDDFDKLKRAKKFSVDYNCVLVIKGAHTIVLHQGKAYINSTGNPGMATAGSGDVLVGMITAFLAQNYNSLSATIFAVYLHGLSGDIVAFKEGYEALTAKGLVANIGEAFLELFKREEQQESTTP